MESKTKINFVEEVLLVGSITMNVKHHNKNYLSLNKIIYCYNNMFMLVIGLGLKVHADQLLMALQLLFMLTDKVYYAIFAR